MKKVFITISFFILLFFVFIGVRFGSALTQEGNPIPYLMAIAEYELSNSGYVQVLETLSGTRYVSEYENKDPLGMVKEFMKREGWKFQEQIGSGLIFEKNKQIITTETRQYSRHYFIWDIPNEIFN